jgi:hypothetical protein
MTERIVAALTGRFRVLRTWGSIARVAAWAAVWTAVLGLVLAPRGPSPADREIEADQPPSDAQYLGPTSHQDFAGFLPPEPPAGTDATFDVAWVGGSEVKLRGVSVAGEVANRIHAFGELPVQVQGYTVVAPRPIDALRAIESAVANGADAVVVSINMVWLSDETSMRDWANLDVANIGTLFEQPASWPWGLSLTSPADVAWRVSRALSPFVEAQQRLNDRAQDVIDKLDIVHHGDEEQADAEADPRLPPDATSFWLVDAYGTEIMDDTTLRVSRMTEGFDDDDPGADQFNRRIVDTAEEAGIPVFLYVAPVSPESLTHPELVAALDKVDAYWTALAADVSSDIVEIEPRPMTDEFADRANFHDVVHMNDAGPFADVIVPRLCDLWHRADPTKECS